MPPPHEPSAHETRRATDALLRFGAGEGASADELLPILYERLRQIAGRWFRRGGRDGTLQPTALVHEAYLHLIDQSAATWKDRAHFCALAATVMRQLVLQHARRKQAARHGGDVRRVGLEPEALAAPAAAIDPLVLDEALERLAARHERQARVVELRFFGGLTIEETAAVLDVATATVELDWRTARAWLRAALVEGDAP